jgi:hypothetical protein
MAGKKNRCCLECRRSRLEPYVSALGHPCVGIACSAHPLTHYCGARVNAGDAWGSMIQCHEDMCHTGALGYCSHSTCPDFSAPPSLGDDT